MSTGRLTFTLTDTCPAFQQIGAEIGRGAFAVVFQAFNVETGDFVAVKRFPLTAIDDESLSSIQVSSFSRKCR